jgi:hypothetical protein
MCKTPFFEVGLDGNNEYDLSFHFYQVRAINGARDRFLIRGSCLLCSNGKVDKNNFQYHFHENYV